MDRVLHLIKLNISNCKLVVEFLNTIASSRHQYIKRVKLEIFKDILPLLCSAINVDPFKEPPKVVAGECHNNTNDILDVSETSLGDAEMDSDDDDVPSQAISVKSCALEQSDEQEILDEAIEETEIIKLVQSALALGFEEDVARLLENLAIQLEKFSPEDLHNSLVFLLPSVLDSLVKERTTIPGLYQAFFQATDHLDWFRYVGTIPQEPNWARKPVSCSLNCSDCTEINAFLGDPKKRHYGLSAGEKRRDHIHSRIEGKPNSLKRYLCSTVGDGYKKERLQVWKKDRGGQRPSKPMSRERRITTSWSKS